MNVGHSTLSSSIQSYSGGEGSGGGPMHHHHHHSMDHSGMMSGGEDLSDCPSTPESPNYTEDPELMGPQAVDDMVAQLAASGPVGVAAAEAINTNRRKRKSYMFETNPSIRKRQQTRLLRKLRSILEEYTMRVGQQAVFISATPGKSPHSTNQNFKVFGSKPLEDVMRNMKGTVMHELEAVLAQRAPSQQADTSNLFELPPLVIDGMPTAVDKMTQAQLRNFIPEMLKYSTGRSKPGWGKPDCQPHWWPAGLPWANVRCDQRSTEEKKRVPWTQALRSIVRNCYLHHGREDLLPSFDMMPNVGGSHHQHFSAEHAGPTAVIQTVNKNGAISIIQISQTDTANMGNAQVVTLSDGTQATVVPGPMTDGGHTVQAIAMSSGVAIDASSGQPIELTDSLPGDETTGAIILETQSIDGRASHQVMIPVSYHQHSHHQQPMITEIVRTDTHISHHHHHQIPTTAGGAGAGGDGASGVVTEEEGEEETGLRMVMGAGEGGDGEVDVGEEKDVKEIVVDHGDGVPAATHAVEVVSMDNSG